jgi:hypothetical protein
MHSDKDKPNEDKKGQGGKPNKIMLVFVINGSATEVEANVNAPLRAAANKALDQSGNEGQPLDSWELKDANGNLLEIDRKVEDYGFASGTKLFLNVKAGVGG